MANVDDLVVSAMMGLDCSHMSNVSDLAVVLLVSG